MLSKILEELELMARIVEKHNINEGIALVEQANYTISNNNKGEKKTSRFYETLGKVMKFLKYVNDVISRICK